MHTPQFTGEGFCARLAAFAALLLLTLSLAPTVMATPITVIASFIGTNGRQPMCGVTFDAAGNMYGTTYRGDSQSGHAPSGGVVWEIAHGTKTITDLAQMDGYAAGAANPYGNVAVDANGNVYGTTNSGGASIRGEVFKVVAGSGTLTDIGDMAFGANPGQWPLAGVTQDAAGDLFGTTSSGSFAGGTIWEIPAGGTLTTIASFLGGGPNGNHCAAGVTLDSSGNLYGTTQYGGVNTDGEVWELPHGSDTVLTLASFNQTNGFYPTGDVAVDAVGNVYGTTTGGGSTSQNAGVVWEVKAGTNTITDLATFAGSNITPTSANGYGPSGNVVLDGAGNLFGTTTYGGTNAFGTVWEIPKNGTLTTIASFSGMNGDAPYGNVTLDAQGNLFGTTASGGPADAGVVWEMAGVGVPVGVGGGTPVPTALTLTPNPAFPDTTLNGTVTFSQSVPASTAVAFTRNRSTSLGSVATPTAGTSLAFTLPLPGYLNGSYTIGATLNGQTASQILTVVSDPNKPVPISIVFSPNPVAPGAAITGTVTLSGPAPAGGLNVEIFENGTDLGPIPVAAGASTTLLGQSLTAGTYTYAALLNGVQVTTTLTVSAASAPPPAASTHILWTNTGGQVSIWNYDTGTGTFTQNGYGPYAGWAAKAIAEGGTDGLARVLWDNANGMMSLWSLNTVSGAFTQNAFGPFPGWTARSVSVAPDNTTHVLWTNTNGAASIWNYSTSTGVYTQNSYGPYPGWVAVSIADGPDGVLRVLWGNTDGRESFWRLNNSTGAFTQTTYGPYGGWSANALSVAADYTTHIVWDNSDGRLSLWNYDVTGLGGFTQTTYGPYGGWFARGVSDGSDGLTRVLWDNVSGQASIWSLNNTSGSFTQYAFGPYAGWTAAALSAAP